MHGDGLLNSLQNYEKILFIVLWLRELWRFKRKGKVHETQFQRSLIINVSYGLKLFIEVWGIACSIFSAIFSALVVRMKDSSALKTNLCSCATVEASEFLSGLC